ncbi:MAG: NADPH dehydrogenase [Oscillospiraceae bacterium]
MSLLTSPALFKNLLLKNRVIMAPMCQYMVTKEDGYANEWHLTHYISRAVGGAGLIIIEATAVSPEGRISNNDLGLWEDGQIAPLAEIVRQAHLYGCKVGIQLAHAGRKAQDAAVPLAPGNLGLPSYNAPKPMDKADIERITQAFANAARRAVKAGFDTIEIHGAHGYLIHEFFSPLINNRTDEYASSALFGAGVVEAVKAVIPTDMPLIMRLSAVEYQDGGYGLSHSLQHSKDFVAAGVDILHISSGGEAEPGKTKPGNYPGYQLPYAKSFKDAYSIPVIGVGMLNYPQLAEAALQNGACDFIGIGRALLRAPYWAYDAEQALNGNIESPPPAYERGFNRR